MAYCEGEGTISDCSGNNNDIIKDGAKLNTKSNDIVLYIFQINDVVLLENEKLLNDTLNKLTVEIIKSEESVDIILSGRVKLLIKEGNKLMLQALSPVLQGNVAGLCGDFDGDSSEDLRDPIGCVYRASDGITYATSWTMQPCPQRSPVLQRLKEHQWDCPKTSALLALPGQMGIKYWRTICCD